jgi:multiple sugar transport system ATP-binding protein
VASIAFSEVSKVFPDGTAAVDCLDLEVEDGGFTVLVGPSGSGKSTALRMVAGLEEATSGTIRIADRVVNDVAPKDRDVAMVFQSYALYPHMDVQDNLGFALKMRGASAVSRYARTGAVARRLGIGDLLARRPRQLSGGQRQRVAWGARSCANRPRS